MLLDGGPFNEYVRMKGGKNRNHISGVVFLVNYYVDICREVQCQDGWERHSAINSATGSVIVTWCFDY